VAAVVAAVVVAAAAAVAAAVVTVAGTGAAVAGRIQRHLGAVREVQIAAGHCCSGPAVHCRVHGNVPRPFAAADHDLACCGHALGDAPPKGYVYSGLSSSRRSADLVLYAISFYGALPYC
jgi:threonine/homoserine/homoserine lactone efflux protein